MPRTDGGIQTGRAPALDDLTQGDLQAFATLWRLNYEEVRHTRVRPCERGPCGGSILAWRDGQPPRCLLCCRSPLD